MLPPDRPSGRIPALDGLRGLAIAMVFLFHFGDDRVAGGAIEKVFLKVTELGWTGVDLFFALSGFLITGILLDSRDKPHAYRDFLARRIWRIFPPYYALLLFLFVGLRRACWHSATYQTFHAEQIWYWLYLQNWRIAFSGWPDFLNVGHLWSLAVEEQFYLVWPSVVLLLGRRTIGRVACALILIAPLLRVGIHCLWPSYVWRLVYVSTITRMDALAAGALIAIILRQPGAIERLRPHAKVAAVASLAILSALLIWRRSFQFKDPVIQMVAFSPLCVLMAITVGRVATEAPDRPLARILSLGPLRWLGRVSYTAYLIHQPILETVRRYEGRATPFGRLTAWSGLLASAAFTLIGAGLSWNLVEKRLLRLASWRQPVRQGVMRPIL
jgi:peptidoglycan/LPS O-acetylase OafA/YrhL